MYKQQKTSRLVMDNLLKQEMDNLKREVGEKVDELSENVKGISETVNEISFALMGNKFTKDGGIIGKMIQMDSHLISIEKRVELLEKATGKKDAQDKIMWTIVGAVGSSVLYLIINFIISLIKK